MGSPERGNPNDPRAGILEHEAEELERHALGTPQAQRLHSAMSFPNAPETRSGMDNPSACGNPARLIRERNTRKTLSCLSHPPGTNETPEKEPSTLIGLELYNPGRPVTALGPQTPDALPALRKSMSLPLIMVGSPGRVLCHIGQKLNPPVTLSDLLRVRASSQMSGQTHPVIDGTPRILPAKIISRSISTKRILI